MASSRSRDRTLQTDTQADDRDRQIRATARAISKMYQPSFQGAGDQVKRARGGTGCARIWVPEGDAVTGLGVSGKWAGPDSGGKARSIRAGEPESRICLSQRRQA